MPTAGGGRRDGEIRTGLDVVDSHFLTYCSSSVLVVGLRLPARRKPLTLSALEPVFPFRMPVPAGRGPVRRLE
jgi:hypothetical protein